MNLKPWCLTVVHCVLDCICLTLQYCGDAHASPTGVEYWLLAGLLEDISVCFLAGLWIYLHLGLAGSDINWITNDYLSLGFTV